MQIRCPECKQALQLGKAKPGSYKPTCKHCQKTFRLKVSDSDPPRVGVAKMEMAGHPKPLAASPQRLSAVAAQPDAASMATMDSSAGTGVGLEAAGGAVGASGFEATSPEPSTMAMSDPSQEATQDGSTIGRSTHAGSLSIATVQRGGSAVKKPSSTHVGGSASIALPAESPSRLGGYRILRMLGRGAMGEVYEAKQVSLDRMVALKTIRASLADNARSLARFTREAYAAAQLSHHNIVQVYDFGEDGGKHFFSMEWIRGGTLSDLVAAKGTVEPRLAATYILQAARGLRVAHQSGIVHRDIKPANLLLSEDGVVKVADLGLVKIPDLPDPDEGEGPSGTALSAAASGTDVTLHGTAVGTPAYMSPEQAADAASVDHRADIYSLGCSLFYLLVGRPPFVGDDIADVMAAHATQAPPVASSINPHAPQRLDVVISRAMAKRPEDRYPTLTEMITELEAFLGVRVDGQFSPTRDQADRWQVIAAAYADQVPASPPWLPTALIGGGGLLMTLVSMVLPWSFVFLGPATLFATAMGMLAIAWRSGRSPVVGHLRSLAGSLCLTDWAVGIAASGLAAILILFTGLWPGCLLGVVLGAGLATMGYFLDSAARDTRERPSVAAARSFLLDLRLAGCDEDGLRDFCARHGGPSWQRLFEVLFGHRSLVEQREVLRADRSFDGNTRGNFWENLRDSLCARLEARMRAHRQHADERKLTKIEQRGLQAEGFSESDAAERALAMAAALVQSTREPSVHDAASSARSSHASAAETAAAMAIKRAKFKSMMADARSGKYKRKRDRLAPVKFLLGTQWRLLAGLAFLAAYALGSQDWFTLDSFQPRSIAIAGGLLVASTLVWSWRLTPFAIVGTAVILLGPSWGLPELADWCPPWMLAVAVGVAVYVPGVLWAESE